MHQRFCRWHLLVLLLVIAAAVLATEPQAAASLAGGAAGQAAVILALPAPRSEGAMSLEQALRQRRSVRDLSAKAVTLADVGQLLWAAQGLTHPRGLRTAPSAGATYPLEIDLVAGQVSGLAAGVYRYLPDQHALTAVAATDVRSELSAAAHDQAWLRTAPASIVVSAVHERTERLYGQRAIRYVDMEVGAVVQNIQLQGAALGLGSTFVGAFDDATVKRVVGLAPAEAALAIVPIGHLETR